MSMAATVPLPHKADISVIDTRKLPKHNTILFTPAMQIIDSSIPAFRFGILAFGKIAGPEHRAVSYQQLIEHRIGHFLGGMHYANPVSRTAMPTSAPDTVQATNNIAKLFGNDFIAPVATYLLYGRDGCDWVVNGRKLGHYRFAGNLVRRSNNQD